MGYERIKEFVDKEIDIIFILNDIWVINIYLGIIKQEWEGRDDMPKIVVYFPVDGAGYTPEWFLHFDIVTKTVVYTEYGKEVVKEVFPQLEVEIIPHGAANTNVFYKLDKTLPEIKEEAIPPRKELWEDSFIVLNANRNQPRKRLDISLLGFALFAKDKPDNVMYYHHAGIKDAGWHFIDLVRRIETELNIPLEKRVVLTNAEMGNQRVPMETLNLIYNACDVGINTSLGEGWGLIQTEHASLGKPQIVGDHSACKELFEDVGLLIPVEQEVRDENHLIRRYFVSAQGLADKLEELYQSPELYQKLAKASEEKFSQPYYDWENIADKWVALFEKLS